VVVEMQRVVGAAAGGKYHHGERQQIAHGRIVAAACNACNPRHRPATVLHPLACIALPAGSRARPVARVVLLRHAPTGCAGID
jgi:hypothetical protein